MRIGGIIDISTKDIPNRSSMVIFTVGCNLSCSFCHNKYLLQPNVGKDTDINEIFKLVKSNLLISGVSISGGEPTLQEDLIHLCREIKKIGKYLSLDTNGTKPHIIERLLPYINRIALDLKGPLKKERYNEITGGIVDPNRIIESFNLVNKQKDIDFEIRTTFVENLMVPGDIHDIIDFLKKNEFKGTFVLQQYQYSEGVGEDLKFVFQKPDHLFLLDILKPYKDVKLPFKIFLRDEIVGYSNIDNLFEQTLDDL
ncbi:MAG: anaerobic ribonucleoside-triphosphate reductase activating protein [Candidatus Hodarchaeota archaeon]